MRNVAIIGCGQTKHSGKRRDVNLAEMVSDAVWNAFEDARITPQDADIFTVGNMQGFGGVAQPEQWLCEWIGAQGKPLLRITTGGSTGGSVVHGAYYAVASGLYDIAVATAWEKHSDSKEAGATTGLAHTAMGNSVNLMQCGASLKHILSMVTVGTAAGVASYQAMYYMHRSGCTTDHFDMVAAKDRRNAAKNKYAHLQWPNCTQEDIAKTEWIAYPIRYGHVCPASDGASCVILANEDVVKRMGVKKPAWIKGLAAYTDEENQLLSESYGGIGITDASQQIGAIVSSKKAYRMAGIKDPQKEIDLAEIYQPFPNQELLFAERIGLFDEGKAWIAMEKGETDINGRIPCCPSGGVQATNAIGSSALQRILECALQISDKAEEHQVSKKVRNAVATGWGGATNYFCMTVLSDSLD